MGARITASSFLLGNSASYRVVGIIVEPPLGQFAADRAGMGVGAYFARGGDLDRVRHRWWPSTPGESRAAT